MDYIIHRQSEGSQSSNHKYIKREGSPGSYKYTYSDTKSSTGSSRSSSSVSKPKKSVNSQVSKSSSTQKTYASTAGNAAYDKQHSKPYSSETVYRFESRINADHSGKYGVAKSNDGTHHKILPEDMTKPTEIKPVSTQTMHTPANEKEYTEKKERQNAEYSGLNNSEYERTAKSFIDTVSTAMISATKYKLGKASEWVDKVLSTIEREARSAVKEYEKKSKGR